MYFITRAIVTSAGLLIFAQRWKHLDLLNIKIRNASSIFFSSSFPFPTARQNEEEEKENDRARKWGFIIPNLSLDRFFFHYGHTTCLTSRFCSPFTVESGGFVAEPRAINMHFERDKTKWNNSFPVRFLVMIFVNYLVSVSFRRGKKTADRKSWNQDFRHPRGERN